MSMSVNWRQTTAIGMPTVPIQLAALSVPATVGLREMESTAQVWNESSNLFNHIYLATNTIDADCCLEILFGSY